MGRLDDKIALVTGAARGMGAAEARLFAGQGAQVVVTDVLDDLGAHTAAGLGAKYLHLDVTSTADWASAAGYVTDTFGRLDILVNNAGIVSAGLGRLDEISVEEHLRIFDVNVHGAFYGMRAMLPLLERGHGASVVNISSIDGLAASDEASYCTGAAFTVDGGHLAGPYREPPA